MTKKFGSWLDEDENVWVGGTTICECLTYCFTCKSNPNTKRKTVQNTDTAEEVEEDGEFVSEEQATAGGGSDSSKTMRRHKMMRAEKAGCCQKMFGSGKASKMSEMELADLNIEIENERLLEGENRGGDKVAQSPSDATMVDSA